ncbi:MAG: alkaline phosphatase family protein [Clostridia bacterium]|nr:alkaline phosphatase family protein [Clostridia bacterium]
MRVLLILSDGMRPDSLTDIPAAQKIIKKSSYTMEASTVMPSVTLPCHMSLFHSVDPSRHGTTTNTYAPQVRPINGLCEVLRKNNKKSAFFYDWEELRDLTRPQSLEYAYYCNLHDTGSKESGKIITDETIKHLTNQYIDFTFLYLGETDEVGHKYGWMSEEYISAVKDSWDNIEKIVNALPDDYTVIITADHGGHDRIHGTDLPEDMTIPMIIMGKDFKAGEKIVNANIKDIAPTVVKLLDTEPDEQWEGKSLI